MFQIWVKLLRKNNKLKQFRILQIQLFEELLKENHWRS